MTGGGGDPPRRRRVLVVEDDEALAALWAQALAADGHEVRALASALGVAGLLRGWRPDVVLLDLGLPYRSGAALLADLKAAPATAGIPVVVLSAAPETLPPGRAALAAAVLGKPIALRCLSEVVRTAGAAGAGGCCPDGRNR